MAKKTVFNLNDEIQKAWLWCWAYLCEPTKVREPIYNDEGYPTGEFEKEERTYPARQSYLTATDLVQRIRCAAAEQLDGKPVGHYGANSHYLTVRISTGGRGDLLGVVRTWLLRNPELEQHNFGRGHISGMRFRPVGSGLTESEAKTVEKKRKRIAGETPVHYRNTPEGRSSFYGSPLCVAPRKRTASYRAPSRSSARLTNEVEKVTCPRCLKKLAEAAKETLANG